jgi:hypothetical protein
MSFDNTDDTASELATDLIRRAFSLDEALEAGACSLENDDFDRRARRLTDVLGGEDKRDVVLSLLR